ncbi:MAG: O-antigen ligase family protein [Bdellovibrio sp.]
MTMISIYVGSGLIYDHFRSYYLFLFLCLPFLVPSFLAQMKWAFKSEFARIRFLVTMPILLLFWYALSLSWADETNTALIYIFYISGGLSISAAVMAASKTELELRHVFTALLVGLSANIIISILETTGHFRWIISRYSPYNSLFKLDPKFAVYLKTLQERQLTCPVEYDYLTSNPAGFFWGPNQLAFALVVSLPFTLLLVKNRVLSTILGLAHIYLLFMAGSRAALVGALIATLVISLTAFRFSKFASILSTTLCAIIICLPFAPLESLGVNPYRANKIASLAGGVSDFKRHCLSSDASDNSADYDREDGSVTTRKLLIQKAWADFKTQPLIGVGAGNSWQTGGVLFGKTHIHNFWLEILFEAGVIIAFLLILWALNIFGFLINALRNSKDLFTNTCSTAIIAAWLGGIPAAVAVGTIAHQPSLWLLLGVTLAFILIQSRNPNKTRAK